MADRTTFLTFPKVILGPGNVCDFCKNTLACYNNPSDPTFRLPCGCIIDLSCITSAFKTQHSIAVFFTCPSCSVDLEGPRTQTLYPPDGDLLRVESIGENMQVSTFHDEDTERITGHLVYRQHYDSNASTLTVMINLVPENDI